MASAPHQPPAGEPASSGGSANLPDQVTGLVERVTFHSPESGFAVLQVQEKGRRDLTTVVGTVPEVRPGEWVDARGWWVVDRVHGRQLKAQALTASPPNTPEGMARYLASGLVKGVGPKTAERLVEKFGVGVFDVIEHHPKRLSEVPGIGKGRQVKITAAWNDQRAVREIMVFLHSHGVSTGRAFRIHKAYGANSIQKVKEDPYRLARDIWGIGFKSADQIAASLGIPRHSDLRARAGVEHALSELTDEGHCAFPRGGLVDRAAGMLGIPRDIIEAAVAHGVENGRLVEGGPDAAGEPLVYLVALDMAERRLAANLVALAAGKHPCPPVDVAKAIAWVEGKAAATGKPGITLAAAQRAAVEQAVVSKVMVITGGPGVGKTTLVNSVVQIFKAKGLKVVLCAPTGRAAKRLTETTGQPATTIHRLLAFDPTTADFKHDQDNPLEGDVFVVDETSMVDLTLAHKTVRAIPPAAALVLVGDVDQLPPVGPGSVLRDVIDSGAVPVCRLTEVFRQAAESAIIANAHRVNKGLMPVFPGKLAEGEKPADFYFVEAEEPDAGVDAILRLVRDSIPRRFGLHPLDDVQVLSPMQRGFLGARNLNLALQAALNPTGPSVERYGWTFRVGDKVMQTVNDYDKDVFNGDIGRVAAIDTDEQELAVTFDGRDVIYDLKELDELSLSYAATVHKSQGSEYPAVVVPIHTQHYTLLQRNLLYTAMTRGKKLVVLVGTKKAVALAVKRGEEGRRVTTLARRLRDAAGLPDTL
jgi:exodeoxyribonuclease V alpha subunit